MVCVRLITPHSTRTLVALQRSTPCSSIPQQIVALSRDPREREACMQEAHIQSAMHHPAVVRCRETLMCRAGKTLYMVLEVATAGDLRSHIKSAATTKARAAKAQEAAAGQYGYCVGAAVSPHVPPRTTGYDDAAAAGGILLGVARLASPLVLPPPISSPA